LIHLQSNDFEETLLHCAAGAKHCSFGNFEVLRMFVEFGIEIDQPGFRGRTALHSACEPISASHVSAMVQGFFSQSAPMFTWPTRRVKRLVIMAAERKNLAELCAFVAAGGDMNGRDDEGYTPIELAVGRGVEWPPSADKIAEARRLIAKTRLDLVRHRAAEICIGLQSLALDALQLCEIVMQSFGMFGNLIAFHQWWAIAIKVKHFHDRKPTSEPTNVNINSSSRSSNTQRAP
jgi:hypothetical protein